MKIHRLSDPYPKEKTVLTIGTFDGVHLGHQKIIKRLLELAAKENLTPTLLTFFPHPKMVLQPDIGIKLLNTIEERKEILKSLGIEVLVIKTFDKKFADLSAEEYIENFLVQKLHAKCVVIGYDHHFGRERSAGIEELKKWSEIFQFKVEEISAKDIDDVSISSTKIRRALESGDIETANTFLGYEFFITGKVVQGRGIGKTIEFPTANIVIPEDYKIIPKRGVYVVKVQAENSNYYGMMNIGNNPTVGGKKESLEVHLLDYDGNLYEKTLRIKFLERIRDEIKFDSIDELKSQLHEDFEYTERFIKGLNE